MQHKATKEEIYAAAAELGITLSPEDTTEYTELLNKQLDGFDVLNIAAADTDAPDTSALVKRR